MGITRDDDVNNGIKESKTKAAAIILGEVRPKKEVSNKTFLEPKGNG